MLHIFKKFEQFLTEERINEIAAKTGFKLRNYGIDARTFLKVILNPKVNIASDSLSKILLDFEDYVFFVTRQSIHEWFNTQCTDFLIEIHNELIKLTLNNKNVIKFNKIPKNISSVLVADSTSIGYTIFMRHFSKVFHQS